MSKYKPYDNVLSLLVFALILSLYVVSTPNTVMLEDDGLFIMASRDAGVAHPPGYPLFTFLGNLFYRLPFGSPAFRIHLLSAVLGALTCAILFRIGKRVGQQSWIATVTALAFGVSEHFWSQAVIAEVYTLNSLICFSVYLLCFESIRTPERRALLLLSGAGLFGLGMANHWPLMVLAFPGFTVLLLPHWKPVLRLLPGLLSVCLFSTGIPYVWMVWRSMQMQLISFYGPITGWRKFWFYVSRQGYAGVDASPSAGWTDKLAFMQHFSTETLAQLTALGTLLASFGMVWLIRNKPPAVWLSGVLIFLGNSIVLILLLGFDYEYLNLAVFRAYPLVAFGFLAIWFGCGLQWLVDTVSRFSFSISGVSLHGVLPLITFTFILFLVWRNWEVNGRRHDRFADSSARLVLETLEPNAIVFIYGDAETGPIGYLRYCEGVRPDVRVLSLQGLVFPDRLFSPLMGRGRQQKIVREFVRGTDRPVYYMVSDKDFPNPYGVLHYGLFKKVNRTGSAKAIQLGFDPRVIAYFRELITMNLPQDRWTRHRHNKLMHQFGDFLGYSLLPGNPSLALQTNPLVEQIRNNYYGLTGMAEILIQHGGLKHLRLVSQWLEEAEALMDETLSKERTGRYYYLRGFLAFRMGEIDNARLMFRRSQNIYNHPDNPSGEALRRLLSSGK